jgi:hypothetical protein
MIVIIGPILVPMIDVNLRFLSYDLPIGVFYYCYYLLLTKILHKTII